jgi:cytochrome c-type biogenesis protein CcmH
MFGAALVYLALALLAAAFVAIPIIRMTAKPLRARIMLAAAAILFVWGVGGGTYLMLGRPDLAIRDFEKPEERNLNGVISLLAEKMRRHPEPEGLLLLGRAYLSAGDAEQAAKTLAAGIAMSKGKPGEDLLTAYAEAILRRDGKLSAEAERALQSVLAVDPDNRDARALLASNDAAAHPPDIGAMVEGLAARLKANPDDPEGWRRLVRAYVVLGDKAKLDAALADARKALAKDPRALAAVEAEAKGPK